MKQLASSNPKNSPFFMNLPYRMLVSICWCRVHEVLEEADYTKDSFLVLSDFMKDLNSCLYDSAHNAWRAQKFTGVLGVTSAKISKRMPPVDWPLTDVGKNFRVRCIWVLFCLAYVRLRYPGEGTVYVD
ncbi:hypothetical protein TSUD_57130 [Trifolium subterraneum]|uniref:Uncharacterized protein n=1 Tax=Trifolium subterraneum TaxID=3900 RepID=A0A2Z6MRZ1_TRISU|nr:hypothetical protein TSUD_57130 [Trifolium subterraneum]